MGNETSMERQGKQGQHARHPPVLQRLLIGTIALAAVACLTYGNQLLSMHPNQRMTRTFVTAVRKQPDKVVVTTVVHHPSESIPHRNMSHRGYLGERGNDLSDDQAQVIEMTKHAWSAYQQFGNYSDHLNMVNMTGQTRYGHDMAYTLVDSLDTLYIMGLHDEFNEASDWVKANLHSRLRQKGEVGFVDTATRSLGGLLSAHYLTGDQHFLDLAVVLGNALENGFGCGTFVPCTRFDLQAWAPKGEPSLAEANSVQLEYVYLNFLAKNHKYIDHVANINDLMRYMIQYSHNDGLIPVQVDWNQVRGQSANISFGTSGNTYYEYTLKQWLQSGKTDDEARDRYVKAIASMQEKLVGRSYPSNYTFVGMRTPEGEFLPKMDHASCSLPGLLALGTLHGLPSDHLKLACELMETCVEMYQLPGKLAPDAVYFRISTNDSDTDAAEMYALPEDDFSLLGPETIESLMILYRVTHDEKYRDHGREIMNSIEARAKVPGGGYRGVRDVTKGPVELHGDIMESFFLSETLKYLFLLFSNDDMLSLDTVVFNTAGHPLPIQYH